MKIALFCLFVLVGGGIVYGSFATPRVEGLPRGYTKPLLALEMSRDADEVKTATDLFHFKLSDREQSSTGAEAKQKEAAQIHAIRQQIWLDFGIFIPAYAALFICLSIFMQRKAVPAAYLPAVIVLAAALCDVGENVRILERLPAFAFSSVKWGLLGIELVAAGLIFAIQGWSRLVGVLYVAAGLVMVAGIWVGGLIEPAFAGMGIVLLITPLVIRRL